MSERRMCTCGHAIWYHEDWDFNIHECNYAECKCQQFKDADEGNDAAPSPQEKK